MLCCRLVCSDVLCNIMFIPVDINISIAREFVAYVVCDSEPFRNCGRLHAKVRPNWCRGGSVGPKTVNVTTFRIINVPQGRIPCTISLQNFQSLWPVPP